MLLKSEIPFVMNYRAVITRKSLKITMLS